MASANLQRYTFPYQYSKIPADRFLLKVTWLLDALQRNDPWEDVDFDAEEAVVRGAAIYAAVFSSWEPVVASYIMATPLSLGLVC